MAILEAIKGTVVVVVGAARANPVAAAGIAVATVAVAGGGIYLRKRCKAKKAQQSKDAADALKEAETAPVDKTESAPEAEATAS